MLNILFVTRNIFAKCNLCRYLKLRSRKSNSGQHFAVEIHIYFENISLRNKDTFQTKNNIFLKNVAYTCIEWKQFYNESMSKLLIGRPIQL